MGRRKFLTLRGKCLNLCNICHQIIWHGAWKDGSAVKTICILSDDLNLVYSTKVRSITPTLKDLILCVSLCVYMCVFIHRETHK